jgi:hypothetical protein
LLGDLLGADMLLRRHAMISAALHDRIVGDNHADSAGDDADAGNDPGS